MNKSSSLPWATHRVCMILFDGILPKGPYPPCWRMADRALLAGYPCIVVVWLTMWCHILSKTSKNFICGSYWHNMKEINLFFVSSLHMYINKHNYLFLTLNVQGPSYLGLTRAISWLLKPWLLTSPRHQQPWYGLCRICRSWSYMRKDFKYMCHINVE